jgi:hypothetical protein
VLHRLDTARAQANLDVSSADYAVAIPATVGSLNYNREVSALWALAMILALTLARPEKLNLGAWVGLANLGRDALRNLLCDTLAQVCLKQNGFPVIPPSALFRATVATLKLHNLNQH